ncbi:hypothetical protein ACHAPU_002423 [Fusarium lateritium]
MSPKPVTIDMDKGIAPRLAALPVEILEIITSYLPNRDIKNLRLTSTFGFSLRMRIERVYLSANLLNIRILKNIADSEVYRRRVTELIWDDTYLSDPDIEKKELGLSFRYDKERRCPEWYVHDSNWHSYQMDEKKNSPDLEAQKMSWEESYSYYLYLSRQQQLVTSSNIDVLAFSHALERFPCLSKVTISTKAHGRLFEPVHQTPMIREFPEGFIYPGGYSLHTPQKAEYLWRDDPDRSKKEYTAHRRGFAAALHVLSRDGDHKVSEFIIEEYAEFDGSWINPDLESPGHTRDDFVSLLKRPKFRSLGIHLERECKCLVCRGDRFENIEGFKHIFALESWSWETSLSHGRQESRWTGSKTLLGTSLEEGYTQSAR